MGFAPPRRSFTAEVATHQRAQSLAVDVNIARGNDRKAYNFQVGQEVHGFRVTSIERIDFFDINCYKFEHVSTGAKWVHMDNSDLNNTFAVLFRTPPDDHTGKPHILEHLALCGS